MPRPIVRLASDKLHRGPWVYSRQVAGPLGSEPEPGALVEVEDAAGRFLGHALWNPYSEIRLRWLSRGRRSALARPREFLLQRIAAADRLRRRTLGLEEVTDAYRVVHAEGDDLPGLVVDRLGPVLVVELHALGFRRLLPEVEWALGELHPELRRAVRVPPGAARAEGFAPEDLPEPAPAEEVVVRERGLELVVRPAAGHKTGYFCDQRENRRLVAELAAGRDVLDLFCNAGGFALHAARAGARRVRAVDLDEAVLELAAASVERSGLAVELGHADAFDVLREVGAGRARPEVVVLDPPKLAAGKRDVERALGKYADLNRLGLEAVAPGGVLATFSCSGAIDLATFLGTVFAAARRAGREIRLLQTLGAGPDHPQTPDWPRSRYLKGALVAVL